MRQDYGLLKAILEKAMAKEGGADGRFSFSPVKKAKKASTLASRLKRAPLSSPQQARKGRPAGDEEDLLSDDDSD